jgi:hypothetical protein
VQAIAPMSSWRRPVGNTAHASSTEHADGAERAAVVAVRWRAMPYRLLCHEPRPSWLAVSNVKCRRRDSREAEVVEISDRGCTVGFADPGQDKAPSVQ